MKAPAEKAISYISNQPFIHKPLLAITNWLMKSEKTIKLGQRLDLLRVWAQYKDVFHWTMKEAWLDSPYS